MTKSNQKFDHYAEKAIGFMSNHEITPRPQNYRVWFEYAAGSTPALNLAVDKIMKDKQAIDEDATVLLHNEFFNHGAKLNAAVEDAGEILSQKLSSALELIKTAGKGTKAYGSALDSISNTLSAQADGEVSGDALTSIVDTLVVATQEMSEHTKRLENKLEDNTREVDELRSHLERTKKEAVTDQLTKLGNRKHFDLEMRKAADEAEKSGKPLCLVMSDIDRFKAFNDTWGHQTGDQVLRLVASCLGSEVRDSDVSARYGGEEFGLILPNTNLEDAQFVAEKVRAAVQSKKIVKRSTGEDLGTITISLGVALYQPGEELSQLVERADACLYRAKEEGRNCVVREDFDSAEKKAS